MIAWSIEAAIEAGCFERIVVSTDSSEIGEVARTAGAQVPFLRANGLADDFTPTTPVVVDAIARLALPEDTPVCCLYATAPFVRSADLLQGLAVLEEGRADFVLPVTTFAFPVQRALRRSDSGCVEMFESGNFDKRSQDLDEGWHDAGQFYWARARSWTDPNAGIFRSNTFGLALPRFRVQDIDTEEDWIRAERLMAAMHLPAS